MASLPLYFDLQFFANDGSIAASHVVHTYADGTTTPKATYTDATGATPNANPITLNSAGRASIWLGDGGYSFELRTSDGTLVKRFDGINSAGAVGSSVLEMLADQGAPTEGAALVAFTQGLAYANGTVGAHLNQWKTLRGAGAVGDGIVNDAAAVATAFAAGGDWDGGGLRYKINSAIPAVASGFGIDNAILDFSGYTTTGSLISVVGTVGAEVLLTANTAQGSNIVTVGSTSAFSADGYVFLKSTAVWSTNTGTYYGHYAKVKSVDSLTQLTLYEDVELPFLTADTASIAPVTAKSGIRIGKNVKIVGSGANTQIGFDLQFVADSSFECTIEDVDYIGVSIFRSINVNVEKAQLRRARKIGTGYGISIAGGCFGARVVNCYAEDQRHAVTIGDNDGLNLHTVISKNVFVNCRSAGIDSHDAAMHTTITDNQVSISSADFAEGITVQSMDAIISGNRLVGVKDSGILFQPGYSAAGFPASCQIVNNEIHLAVSSPDSAIPIVVQANAGCDIDGVVIADNKSLGGSAIAVVHTIYILASAANRAIRNVSITGNVASVLATNFSLYLRTQGASAVIDRVTISSNQLGTTGTRCVKFLTDGAGSSISNVNGGLNQLEGGSAASVDLDTTVAGFHFGLNYYIGATTKFLVNAASSNVYLEDLDKEPATTITNATATIAAVTNWYICNRGATITLTLPAAALYPGRPMLISTLQAFTVVSASANVVPMTGGAAGTAILPATAGAWAIIVSDGSNWLVKSRG
jgi:hypothetical protein